MIFVISYFLISVMFNRGWIDEFRATFESLNCILAFPILIASLLLVISAIRYPVMHRNWRSFVPILAIIGAILVVVFLPTKPTKAEMIFREQRSKLELLNQQAENAQGARRVLKINIDSATKGQWVKYYHRDNQQVVTCLKIKIGNQMALVRTSTGDLEDCHVTFGVGGPKWGTRCDINEPGCAIYIGDGPGMFLDKCASVHRLDENWFETNEGNALLPCLLRRRINPYPIP